MFENIPNGYHISKGADNVFYILNDGEDYLGKLSTDLSTAKKIAIQRISTLNPDYFKNNKLTIKVWNRQKHFTERKKYFDNLTQYDQHITDHQLHLDSREIAERQKKIKDKYSKFSHLGELGKQITLELTITKIFSYVGDYGLTFVHKFKDNNGNQVIYFGHSKQLVDKTAKAKFQEGNKITITGIVKDHSKDRDDHNMPLTVITKPKITKERK
tara:strand:- start:195 stop:836 length:642 start_codon:yes stop_codon:yes gene_type:complete